MTRRPTALVIAMAFAFIAVSGTQVNARDQKKPFINRHCLDAPTRSLLNNLEARFGKVALVKVCVAGARMPSGHVSWHARNKAFDFRVPKRVDQRDVMVWLSKNSPGVTISYRGKLSGIIHTDTGTFHKVIYNAASHEAGERAVAIWQERAKERVGLDAVAALPVERPAKRERDQPLAEDWSAFVADAPVEAPLPLPEDRRSIFVRYVESRDIVVKPWVTTSCPGGKDLPKGLQALLKDAGAYYGRTVYLNSAYRSPAYNRRVGGARSSQHMQCRAVDFRVAGVSPGELKRWIVAHLPKWGITGLGTYASHTHADVGPRKATRLVQWHGGAKKRLRYAKHRKPSRYAAAG